MTDLIVGIVNWNTRDLLRELLSSIYAETEGIDFQVWVVDNGSSDDSVELVKGEFPQVNLIENSENLGFSRANNQVLRKCQGRYLLLLNSDTRLVGNTLKGLVDFMDDHPEAGAAGCRILNDDGTLQRSCGRFPRLWSIFLGGEFCNSQFKKIFPDRVFFAEYGLDEAAHGQIQKIDFVMGCCLILRGSILEQVGLLDEKIFMYFEEIDLCYRIKQQGWQVMYTPNTELIHLGGQSSKVLSKSIYRNLDGQAYFFGKHYGLLYTMALKIVVLAGALLRLPLFTLISVAGNDTDRPIMKRKVLLNLYSLVWFFKRIFSKGYEV